MSASNNGNNAATNKKKPKQIDFIVNTGNPNDASSQANKKRVRSVAALKSWPERRKKIFEQLESSSAGGSGSGSGSGSGQSAFLVETEPTTTSSKSTTTFTAGPGSSSERKRTTSTTSTIAGPPRPAPPPPPTKEPTYIGLGAGSSLALYHDALSRVPATKAAVEQVHLVHPDTPCQCKQCRSKRRIANTPLGAVSSTQYVVPERRKRMADGSEKPMAFVGGGDMAMLTPPSSPAPSPDRGRADPFNCYPVPYQPWFDHILHHMMTVYAPRGWPALKITDEQGVKWEWFMTQNALSEPALFYVRLLFGSGDMIKLGTVRSEIMYWLRAQAIKAINDALAEPSRACSDAIILAVGRIALHEHMYGDKHASAHVHRPAQKRMIEMRGGMKALEFPELVKRLMRWSDRIMAVGSGTERLLEDDESNPNFTLRESVGAIERWAPHEMPGVRSKIRISDLVNEEDEE
ncbi:hypothetical protein M409DRAFT_58517 [Zasmidium cellare ATCC 36951]|uniref:Uncharacterized protein n=1 Tax=Zasmidium cellare ATCC 36951 TaxID=1080233 RepID=A0A6A6C4V8_ZASCE|nr:uncharacterized protein M409DRAFT_58517 [Zasmidium cellare ATCC 36951]KAF2162061.1 hypothetical protein M409DRAFT_58517 [Zasmidium cellare ATCC 36951]